MLSQSSHDPFTSERLGIIPRAVSQIFDEIDKRLQSSDKRLKIETHNSYVEIYNEDLIDLLAGDLGADERPAVQIREDKHGNIIWSGLRELKVLTAQEVMR